MLVEYCNESPESKLFCTFIYRPLRGLEHVGLVPQARLRHHLGLALSPPASQAG